MCYPPRKAEGYRYGVVRPAVRPSVRPDIRMSGCPDVRPSVTNFLGLYLKDFYRLEHETSGMYRSH